MAISENEYLNAFSQGVHFSSKSVNTNAKGFGVRLATKHAKPLPYISVHRFLAEGSELPLDYADAVNILGPVYKRIAQIMAWGADASETDVTPDERDYVAKQFKLTDQHTEVGDPTIGPRLKQLLFPVADTYHSLIPLHSTPFSFVLQQRIHQHFTNMSETPRALRPAARRIDHAFMDYGGANPHNGGRFLYAMKRPFIFTAPEENKKIREAYALHYRGASIALPREAMMALREQLDGPDNGYARRHTIRLLNNLITTLMARGDYAFEILTQHLAVLPFGRLLDNGVRADIKGLTDKTCRTTQWKKQFAYQLAKNISGYRFAKDDHFGLSAERAHLLNRILYKALIRYV